VSTLADSRWRAAAMRQKLARFPAAVHILVAAAAINIAMKQIATPFVRYKPEAGRRAGRISQPTRKSGGLNPMSTLALVNGRATGRRSAPIAAAHGGCWPAGHIRGILAL